ncbi:hypothetical protein, partial [Salmonella enterica]|uniref:hypothetical protein n=1 Tax=Salmonella enterica TaxID=28901 RepID=UPI001C39281A
SLAARAPRACAFICCAPECVYLHNLSISTSEENIKFIVTINVGFLIGLTIVGRRKNGHKFVTPEWGVYRLPSH